MSSKSTNVEAVKRMYASASAYKRVFVENEDGYKILIDLMRKFHMMSPTTTKDMNPNEMLFNEGARNVVLYIMTKCNVNIQQLQEYIEGADNADI